MAKAKLELKATKCKHGVATLMKAGDCEGCPDYDKCTIPTIDEFFGLKGE